MNSSPGTDTGKHSQLLNLIANIVGSIGILGLGVFGLLFFGHRPEVPKTTGDSDASKLAPLVDTVPAVLWDKPFHLDIDGEASTWRVITVGAEVTGKILKKSEESRSGGFVNKGDVLFEIDSESYRLDEQRLLARVEQAREDLNSVDVEIGNTNSLLKLATEDNRLQQDHLARIRSLYDRKATSETEIDNAEKQELTSRNALQMQQNQLNALLQSKKTKQAALQLAQAELDRVRLDLQRCRIVAPVTGRIVDDMREEGDYVKPGDILVHISDSSRMEVKCSLKGEELAWIWQQGQQSSPAAIETSESQVADGNDRKEDPFRMPQVPCEISFEFEGAETVWEGQLSRYEGTGMDRNTRMFPCRVMVQEPEKTRVNNPTGSRTVSPPTLLSGMFVNIRVPIDSPVPLLKIPAEAIRPGDRIWIVRNGALRTLPVRLVQVDQETALVRQDALELKPGDPVIVSPLVSIREGMSVTIHESAKDANVDSGAKAEAGKLNEETAR